MSLRGKSIFKYSKFGSSINILFTYFNFFGKFVQYIERRVNVISFADNDVKDTSAKISFKPTFDDYHFYYYNECCIHERFSKRESIHGLSM